MKNLTKNKRGRPPLRDNERKRQVTLSMPKELEHNLKQIAKEQERSLSSVLYLAAKEYYEKYKSDKLSEG